MAQACCQKPQSNHVMQWLAMYYMGYLVAKAKISQLSGAKTKLICIREVTEQHGVKKDGQIFKSNWKINVCLL